MNIKDIIYKIDESYIFEISKIINIKYDDIVILNDEWNKRSLDNKKIYNNSYNEGIKIKIVNFIDINQTVMNVYLLL